MFKTVPALIMILCACSVASAQSVKLPVLSFVPDEADGIRPMFGIPGSASIGERLNLGFGIMHAEARPAQDYILAITPDSGWPVLVQMRADGITVQSIEPRMTRQRVPQTREFNNRVVSPIDPPAAQQETTKIDRVALSPTGSAAAFFSESQGRLYVLSNMPHSPTGIGEIQMRHLGTLTAFGISDDARTLAFGVSDGTSGSLFVADVAGDRIPHLVGSMGRPSAVEFLHNSGNAVIADDVGNKIHALSGNQLFTMATAESGISQPIGLAVSNDNQRIFVGNAANRSVTTIGHNGAVIENTACDCTLTGLHPTNVDSVFRLSGFSGGPVLLFDASGAIPRITFVTANSR